MGCLSLALCHRNRERLRGHYGLDKQVPQPTKAEQRDKMKKDSTRAAIDKINQNRENRRRRIEEKRKIKLEKEVTNQQMGIKCDVDFQLMVEGERAKVKKAEPHKIPDLSKINICVRKRPLFQKEANKGEIDCVSCTNPAIIVHKCRYKVDGITKFVDNDGFEFDNAFSEHETSDSVYYSSIQPQIDYLFDGGIVTCFAYGQTGSGKTFTMEGVQKLAVNDFFAGADIMKEETGRMFTFTVSYFEIYNGKIFDLLDSHNQRKVQEDRSGTIQIPGLKEVQARSADEMTQLIEYGLSERKTKSTACNDTSSRSHAIGTISIKEINKRNQVIAESGKLLLVDLAGSEKAQDSQSNIKTRRIEGAEINTSLLSLKECIRAMEHNKKHVPFRQSKLTMVLRDSFIGGPSKNHVIMIACIAPDQSSNDHTLNTLRYAERLKETTDDEEILDKYVSTKPTRANEQQYDDEECDIYDNSVSNEIATKRSEDFETEYKDPRLYQSHDFSVHTESRGFNEMNAEHVLEAEQPTHIKNASHIEYKKPVEYQFENQEFNDSMNLIEYNQGVTKTYETDHVTHIDHETSKHLEPDSTRAYDSRPKDYTISNTKTYEPAFEPTYVQPPKEASYTRSPHEPAYGQQTNDEDRYKQDFNREYDNYKRQYNGEPEVENEDHLMQVDSDGSDEHHSPQLYISSNKESSFTKRHLAIKNSSIQNIERKPGMSHSNSNNRLRYRVDIRPNPVTYNREKVTSSTSHITTHYQRTRPVVDVNLEPVVKESLNRTTYENRHAIKPVSKTLSYNNRPVVGRKNYYEQPKRDVDLDRIVDSKKYTEYFRSDGTYPNRPNTTATLGRRVAKY
jgi:hypothetical protein